MAVEIPISQSYKTAVAQHLSKLLLRVQKTAVFKGNSTAFKGNSKSSAFKNDHSKPNVRPSCGLVRAGSPWRCQWEGICLPSCSPWQQTGRKVGEPRLTWVRMGRSASSGCSRGMQRSPSQRRPYVGSSALRINPGVWGLHCGQAHTRQRGEKFWAVLLSLTFPALAASSARLTQGLPAGNVGSCLPLCRGDPCRAIKMQGCEALL